MEKEALRMEKHSLNSWRIPMPVWGTQTLYQYKAQLFTALDRVFQNLYTATLLRKNINVNSNFNDVLFAILAKIFQEIMFETNFKETGNTLTCTIDTKQKFNVP